MFLRSFLEEYEIEAISGDKMMNRAKGPVWHKKQKEKGIIPERLRGIDKEATWSKSKYDGWIYGHGSFCMVTHELSVVGCFQWMRNSADEAKRLWTETGSLKGMVSNVCMDSKADDQDLYREFQQQRGMQLITYANPKHDGTPQRKEMIRTLKRKKFRRIYRERSQTVEPMQGVRKEIFELERCWMRGDASNRWLFAAMGVAVQIAQLQAILDNRSTWSIRNEVLGL
jgi:hypothetical protein